MLTLALTVLTVFWVPGGNTLVWTTLVPESLAWIPGLLAVEAFVRGRTVCAGLWIAAAGWLQPLIGLQLGLMLGIVGLWRLADGDPRGALRQSLVFGVTALAAMAPVLVPTLLTQTDTVPPDDGLSTFYVTAYLRQAHHYLLSAQSPVTLARFAAIVAVGLGGLAVLSRRAELDRDRTRFAIRLLVVVGVLCVLYVAGTEGLRSVTVAKMQFFRLLVVAKLVLLAWTAGAVVALVPVRLGAWAERAASRPSWGWGGALAVVVLTVGLAAADVGRPGAMWGPRAHRQTDAYRAEAWIAANTPRDALFLVPPGTTTFRSHALRSVALNFKPTTFRDDAMHRWLARMRVLAPAPLPPLVRSGDGVYAWRQSLDPAYHDRTPAEWEALARTFGADHALLDLRQTPTPPAGEPLFQSGPWAVYRL